MAHMHYKGTGKVHSFKGHMATEHLGVGGQEKIRIEGATGEIAWRITKFQIMPNNPGGASYEYCVKIFREEQTSIVNTINFDDDELLAAAIYHDNTGTGRADSGPVIIFDNALFSRNIYITAFDNVGTESVNYYIELEEIKLSAAGMAQLAVAASRRT